MDTIAFSINDKNVGCAAGSSILDAAACHGIKIPTLCHHPDLKPHGACRMCLVEDEATGRLMAACVTPAAPNMKIRTDSERVIRHRRNIVRLMIAEHPESCIVCSKGNRCRLRQTAAQLGVGETRLYPMPNHKALEQANPFIVRDLSKCILCGKCIRADHELVVTGAIDYNLRGFRSRPATVHDQALEKSNCTFCGTCVSMCPTGALSISDKNYVGTPEKVFNSICGFCAVGCALALGAHGDKIVEVNPANLSESVNRSTLCVRGHFAHDYLNSANRLLSPMLRSDENTTQNKLSAVSWQQAIGTIAARLKEISKTNGPQSIAFIGSAKASIEENYLLQKIARAIIGTNNVDYGGYVTGQALQATIDHRTGGRWRFNPLSAIEQTEVIFLIGADPCQTLPVVSYHIKRAAKLGVPLVVVDPRRTDLAKMASHWLSLKPGGDLALINSLAAALLTSGTYDAAFVDRYTEGFSVYRVGLSGLDLTANAAAAGVLPESIEAVARLMAGKRITWIAGSGFSRQQNRSHSVDALINLALMCGGWEQPGAGLFLLPKECNAVGAADMGLRPGLLPGRGSIRNLDFLKCWEKAWGKKISPDAGLSLPRMIEEAEKGHLKALYIMGENPLRAMPQQERVRAALKKIEFLVVQDILSTETAELADAVLPGAAFAEKSGAFTNLEGRIQSFSTAVKPPGRAKPDWEVLVLLADALAAGKSYESIDQIRTEIAALIPMYADIENGGSGWIKDTAPDASGDTAFPPVEFTPVANDQNIPTPDPLHPYTAIFGTRRMHLGSGTRTGNSQRISMQSGHATVDLSPADVADLNLDEGELVQVFSPHGSINRRVRSNNELKSGLLFVPLAVAENEAVNLLALSFRSDPPELGRLVCPVGIKKIEGNRRP